MLDTEPLYGELLIDRFEYGYFRNALFAKTFILKSSAKLGLSEFKESSEFHDLEIFANKAQGHLENFE